VQPDVPGLAAAIRAIRAVAVSRGCAARTSTSPRDQARQVVIRRSLANRLELDRRGRPSSILRR
jgi:hypothetical protein